MIWRDRFEEDTGRKAGEQDEGAGGISYRDDSVDYGRLCGPDGYSHCLRNY